MKKKIRPLTNKEIAVRALYRISMMIQTRYDLSNHDTEALTCSIDLVEESFSKELFREAE